MIQLRDVVILAVLTAACTTRPPPGSALEKAGAVPAGNAWVSCDPADAAPCYRCYLTHDTTTGGPRTFWCRPNGRTLRYSR